MRARVAWRFDPDTSDKQNGSVAVQCAVSVLVMGLDLCLDLSGDMCAANDGGR